MGCVVFMKIIILSMKWELDKKVVLAKYVDENNASLIEMASG